MGNDNFLSVSEMWTYGTENGIIDESVIRAQMEMNERKKYIEAHEDEIWFASDGYYKVRVPDENGKRKIIKRRKRDDLLDAICAYYRSRENEPTIQDVYNQWIEEKLEYGEILKQSADRYSDDFDRFFMNNERFKNFGKRKIRYVTEEDIEKFIKGSIASMHLTQKAYSGMRILINGIFKYAKKHKYSSLSITNCMGDIEISEKSFKKVTKTKETEVYQEEEAEKLVAYLANQKDCIRCQGLLLLFETGLRIGELCGLKPEDVSQKNFIHIQRTEIKVRDENQKWKLQIQEATKTGAGTRKVVTSDKAFETINNIMRLRSDGEYLFMENGKLLTSKSFRKKLMRVCKELNIEYKSNHKIRKTYGTMLIDGDVDESFIAEQMGHSDVATTREYYYYSNKRDNKRKQQINDVIPY